MSGNDLPAAVDAAETIAAHGQAIWAGYCPSRTPTLMDAAVAATTVVGDLARAARDDRREDAVRELGNLILSAPRWAAALGLNLGECVEAADRAQRDWVARHG